MGILSGPHFEVPSTALARWLDERGQGTWWSVDGDPFLAGQIAFPCPTEEVANLLRRVNRPLLIGDRLNRPDANGKIIAWNELDEQVKLLGTSTPELRPSEPEPPGGADRLFWLCWKDRPHEWAEWMLVEDKAAAAAFAEDNAPAESKG